MRILLSWLLGTLLLTSCVAHEHLHVYGQVLDVTKHEQGDAVEGAEVWTVTPQGVPVRHLATSDRRGNYEVEVPPALHTGGVGVRKPGYRSEWWPIGRLKRSERRAHTKCLDLPVVRTNAPAGRPRAGQPLED